MNILGWDEIERTGHNPTVYLDAAEERYFESGQWLRDMEEKEAKTKPGCWNCYNYDGAHCTKEWNNLDPCYYIDWRDDKEPTDYCEDHDKDESIKWEDVFEED